MKRLIRLLMVLKIHSKEFFWEKIARYMPMIPRKRPPTKICGCGSDMEIEAYFIGCDDGWDFYWVCTAGCPFPEPMDEPWFPFIFNWCSEKDLVRIGIRVV